MADTSIIAKEDTVQIIVGDDLKLWHAGVVENLASVDAFAVRVLGMGIHPGGHIAHRVNPVGIVEIGICG